MCACNVAVSIAVHADSLIGMDRSIGALGITEPQGAISGDSVVSKGGRPDSSLYRPGYIATGNFTNSSYRNDCGTGALGVNPQRICTGDFCVIVNIVMGVGSIT